MTRRTMTNATTLCGVLLGATWLLVGCGQPAAPPAVTTKAPAPKIDGTKFVLTEEPVEAKTVDEVRETRQLLEECRIALTFREGVPFDGLAARNRSDIVQLGIGAHVDEFRASLHQGMRFGRQKGTGVGELELQPAVLGVFLGFVVHGMPIIGSRPDRT